MFAFGENVKESRVSLHTNYFWNEKKKREATTQKEKQDSFYLLELILD